MVWPNGCINFKIRYAKDITRGNKVKGVAFIVGGEIDMLNQLIGIYGIDKFWGSCSVRFIDVYIEISYYKRFKAITRKLNIQQIGEFVMK